MSKRPLTSWKFAIDCVLKEIGEELIGSTLTKEQAERDFDCGYGGTNGIPFTAWTENWVLFPAQYDGSEWVERVPRHPCTIKTDHVGGG